MIARDGAAMLYLNPVDLAGCAHQCIEARGRGAAITSLHVVRPPMRMPSGSGEIPLISLRAEISTTEPETGRSSRAGKKSVAPNRI
jgi:hypothetical protein